MGKRYERLFNEKKVKSLEREVVILYITSWLSVLLSLFLMFLLTFLAYQVGVFQLEDSIPSLDILNFDNLTDLEIKNSIKSTEGFPEYYFEGIKNITFTKDISEDTLGMYRGGKIVVSYRDNPQLMKETLFHEIMHHFMKSQCDDCATHKIIYDLGNSYKCILEKADGV